MTEQLTDDPPADAERAHGHEHTSYCYWDLYRCGWVCRPVPPLVETGRKDDACTSST